MTDRLWIPALDHDGRPRPVSLRGAFAEAAELRTIVGDLPTQTFAILRLLLAVLHRAVEGPEDERAWRGLWQSPGLPVDAIDDYLAEFPDRFDLLHPVTPFYQVADLETGKGDVTGLDRLIADVPTGAPYLTNRLAGGLDRITPAEAARWVVHCQAYDTSGIKSGAVGDPRVKGGKGYPIGTGICGNLGGIFLEGQNLRETLLLNLIPQDNDYLQSDPRDAPVWERPPHGPAEELAQHRGPYGLLSLYTWQARRIRLVGDENWITGALVTNGDKLGWENRNRLEPMSGWRRSKNQEKALKLPQVYMPALHDPTRALWRGLGSLLTATPAPRGGADGPARVAPVLIQWLARLRNAGHLDASYRVTTRAVGVVYGTQQSVIDEIYHDSLTMTAQAFHPAGELRTTIVDSAADAESAATALRTLAANLCRASGGTGREQKDPPTVAAVRASENAFAALDQQFRRWLGQLTPATDPAQARSQWQATAYRIVSRLGADLVAQAGPHAWAGRYVDKDKYLSSPLADLFFRQALRRALPLAADRETTPGDNLDLQEVPA
ncbi:type I-E CRISPR-associated protein Cse1/CasA [Micromonospora sp. NPDC050397]|uniref:type I-E CRISPR-associated protein Cse1/CasA n=1 Tax=Micromonospora sp. NPDC050397 TaxID=3364279 RepID=UPI00384DF1AE